MDVKLTKSQDWGGNDYLSQDAPSTSDPMVTRFEIVEEVPTLTVAAIVGMATFILIAIVIVFVLGVFIDCRQQRIIDSQLSTVKRIRNQRRARNIPLEEGTSIADNMEEQSSSQAPAEILGRIP